MKERDPGLLNLFSCKIDNVMKSETVFNGLKMEHRPINNEITLHSWTIGHSGCVCVCLYIKKGANNDISSELTGKINDK